MDREGPPIRLASAGADNGPFAGFAALRGAASEIAQDAELVRIDDRALELYAAGLAEEERDSQEALLEPGIWFTRTPNGATAFALVADCINFGSGYFPGLRKDRSNSGYKTMAAGLAAYFEANWPFPPSRLELLDPPAMLAILGQAEDASAEARELAEMMAVALTGLGVRLRTEFGDSFETFFARTAGEPSGLVEELYALDAYRDGYLWKGIRFQPAKKAQITVSDLSLVRNHFARLEGLPVAEAAPAAGPGLLTAFADNSVPQVLEADGILGYRQDLSQLIASGVELEYGSQAEIEIRACTITAVERLSGALGGALPPAGIDALLWNRKHDPAREDHYRARPSHKTRSRFY